jgi:flagellar biogenesis protein FliO
MRAAATLVVGAALFGFSAGADAQAVDPPRTVVDGSASERSVEPVLGGPPLAHGAQGLPEGLPTAVTEPFGAPATAPRRVIEPRSGSPAETPLLPERGAQPSDDLRGVLGGGGSGVPSLARLGALGTITALLVGLAWWWQRRRGAVASGQREGRRMEHLQTLRVGGAQSITLMQIGDRTLLVGVTATQISVLADFGPEGSFEKALETERRAALERYAIGEFDAVERRMTKRPAKASEPSRAVPSRAEPAERGEEDASMPILVPERPRRAPPLADRETVAAPVVTSETRDGEMESIRTALLKFGGGTR